MTVDDDLDKTLLMLSNLGRTALEALAFTALRTAKKHEAAVALAEADAAYADAYSIYTAAHRDPAFDIDGLDRLLDRQLSAMEAHDAALAAYRAEHGA